MTHDARRLFVTRFISPDTHGELVEVDPLTFSRVRTVQLAFDPGPDTESSGRGLPNALHSPAITPDGRSLWIPSKKDNIARGATRDGQTLTFESTVRAITSVIDLSTNSEDLSGRHDYNNREGAVSVRFSPRGDYAFVALQGSNAIDVLDAYSGDLVTSLENVGRAPQGLVFTADGGKLFIHSWLTRSVLVYDVSSIINPGSQRAKFLADIPVVADQLLSPQVLEGKRVFYNSADARMSRHQYLSCASCHLDSREDGRTWDRTAEGEGLRNTISLLSRGRPEHGRIHWTANFDEIQDFEHDVRTMFGGLGFITDAELAVGTRDLPLGDPKTGLAPELDALAAYMTSLAELPPSPYRNPDGTLTQDAIAGKAIFQQLNCAACHNGPIYTDSPQGLLHDIGGLKVTSGRRLGLPLLGLDTPSLVGLWLSAPYLHDGSAATLENLLMDQLPGSPHGDIAPLLLNNPSALAQLTSYLLQLDGQEEGAQPMEPAINLVTPRDGDIFVPSQTIPLAVDTTQHLAPVAKVEFYADSQLLGEKVSALYTFDWQGASAGEHILTARLVYTNGAKTTASPVKITVLPPSE